MRSRHAIDFRKEEAVVKMVAKVKSLDKAIYVAQMGWSPRGITVVDWIDKLQNDKDVICERLHALLCTLQQRLQHNIRCKTLMHMR